MVEMKHCVTLFVAIVYIWFFIGFPIVLLTPKLEYTKLNDQIISNNTYNFYDYKENCRKSNFNDELCMTIFHGDILYPAKLCSASKHPYIDYDTANITTCNYQYTNQSKYTLNIGAYWKYKINGNKLTDIIIKKISTICNGTIEQIYTCRQTYYNNFKSETIWCNFRGCVYEIPTDREICAIILIIIGFITSILLVYIFMKSARRDSINQPLLSL